MLCNGNEASGGSVAPNYPWPLSMFHPCRLAAIDPDGYYGIDAFHPLFGLDAPYVISNDPAQAQPNRGFPAMGYLGPQWVSPYEFCKLMPKYDVPCNIAWPAPDNEIGFVNPGPIPPDPPSVNDLLTATEFLCIAGIVDRYAHGFFRGRWP